jgi:arsenite methyltransferase
VAGALAERDFVGKLEKSGFEEVRVLERTRMSVDDLAMYPLFTDELLELIRALVPAERQAELAVAAVVSARLPGP